MIQTQATRSKFRNHWLHALVCLALLTSLLASRSLAKTTSDPSAQKTSSTKQSEDQRDHSAPPNYLSVSSLLKAGSSKVPAKFKISCGGEPNQRQLEFLAKQGFKTVVSVDSASPNLQVARKLGLKYVHIPLGYDGIKSDEQLQLLAVVRKCQSPIYVHCHHGHHRAPAATAALLRVAGFIGPAKATEILRKGGTSESYAGLWRDVKTATALKTSVDDIELRESCDVPTLAANMAILDRRTDELEKLLQNVGKQRAGRTKARDVALLVIESLKESARDVKTEEVDAEPEQCGKLPEDYVSKMQACLKAATTLHDTLAKDLPTPNERAALQKSFRQLRSSCSSCHQQFRN